MELKTKEDYYLIQEERLLTRMESTSTALNFYLVVAYAIALFLLMNNYGMVEDLNVLGWSKLNIKSLYLFLIASFLLAGTYMMINYYLYLMRYIYLESKDLWGKAKEINPDAVPLNLTTLQYYTKGLGGLFFFFIHILNKKYLSLGNIRNLSLTKYFQKIKEEYTVLVDRFRRPKNYIISFLYYIFQGILLLIVVIATLVTDLIRLLLQLVSPPLLAIIFSFLLGFPLMASVNIIAVNLSGIKEALPHFFFQYNLIQTSLLILFLTAIFTFYIAVGIVRFLISEFR